MVVIGIALLVMLVGLILYIAMPNKWAEIGRIMFFCGLLVTLFAISGKPVARFGN